MSSSIIQRNIPLGFTSLRNLVTWFLITMLSLYVLYTFKIIVLNKDQDCSSAVDSGISATQRTVTTFPSPPPAFGNTTLITPIDKVGTPQCPSCPPMLFRDDTQLKHIAFGIAASANLWEERKEYIKVWWRPGETRGVVWLDTNVRSNKYDGLPDIKISGDTSGFEYTNENGNRSALRISRVISETLRLGLKDVRWFVMGDDDTVFIVENLVRILNKYDHNQLYYIGSVSESHIQNIHFSYAMAYGGGGFAISYSLAKELESMQDKCIRRYPALYGSDDRIQACMSELGVPLIKETGFHQYDIYGNLLGLLAAHPVTPLVSIHHLDVVDPIFPEMNRVQSLRHLFESAKFDSASLIQQSICYYKKNSWTISVSWGYIVQIIHGVISPREMEMPLRTFLNWYPGADYTAYAFNTRSVEDRPCLKPYLFYMSTTRYDREKNQIIGIYNAHKETHPDCKAKGRLPGSIDSVVVMKSPDKDRWMKSPRRDCCRVGQGRRKGSLHVWVKNCDQGEFSGLREKKH